MNAKGRIIADFNGDVPRSLPIIWHDRVNIRPRSLAFQMESAILARLDLPHSAGLSDKSQKKAMKGWVFE